MFAGFFEILDRRYNRRSKAFVITSPIAILANALRVICMAITGTVSNFTLRVDLEVGIPIALSSHFL